MILRKPYAFLIKYFRLIHILMFVLFTYLIFSLRPIHIFFSDYLSGNNNMYFENMASKYIPFILFIVVVIILALAIGIFFLMRKKEKPVLFYKLVILYSSILLIALIYFYFFFKSLSTTNYNNLRIVINRDVIMIIYYIDFFFVGFSFIRAFGFDIKKFSFDKDRRELKLEETDNEEYEVDVKLEKEDILNYINRQIREFKYYFQENSKFFIIVLSIMVVSLVSYFSYSHFVVNRIYKQKDVVTIGNVTYNITKSIITTHDKYGKVINEDNDFLVVYINISNNGSKITLDDQQFRVNVSDNYYYPSVSYCESFNDLGTCYHDNNLAANSKEDYIMIYKLEKKHSKIFMEILKSKKGYQYSKVKLNFTNDYKEIENYNRGDGIIINESTYRVINYQFLTKTTYTYEECSNNKCDKYTKIVKPSLGNQVLAIEIANLDGLTDDFLNNYMGLKYRNKVLYGSDIELLARYQNVVYFGVPNLVHSEDKLVLTINTRDKEYDVLLKEWYYE